MFTSNQLIFTVIKYKLCISIQLEYVSSTFGQKLMKTYYLNYYFQGSFICKCEEDYMGDGRVSCILEDACSTVHCGPFAHCLGMAHHTLYEPTE